jgi:[ribosomal protein S5]-alanine N-acetyltransferase
MSPNESDLPTLRSPRLLLTPLTAGHLNQFASIAGDHRIADTTISVPHPLTEETARVWISKAVRESMERLAAHYCVTIATEAEQMIGYVGLKAIDREHGEGEMSFWLHPDQQGKGYMTEAATCILGFGFNVLRLNRICAYHMARNPASGRVLAKIGFQQEGLLRERVRKWGVYEDVLVWSKLAANDVEGRLFSYRST